MTNDGAMAAAPKPSAGGVPLRAPPGGMDSLTDALARALHAAATGAGDVALHPSLDLFGAERFGPRPEDMEGDDDTEVDLDRSALQGLRG